MWMKDVNATETAVILKINIIMWKTGKSKKKAHDLLNINTIVILYELYYCTYII